MVHAADSLLLTKPLSNISREENLHPQGAAFDAAVEKWKALKSDEDAVFDKELHFDAADIEPMITYGTNPGMGAKIKDHIPAVEEIESGNRESFKKSTGLYGI